MTQTGNDRRREPRALTAALVRLIDEHDDTSTCVLEDLSSSGACVHSDIPLQVGVPVTVNAGSNAHAAVVKYCKPDVGGFSIGLEFMDGQWPDPIEFPIHWIRVRNHEF